MRSSEVLGSLLWRVAKKIHYRVDNEFVPYGITVEQWTALRTIKEHEKKAFCQKDLALTIHKNQNTIKSLITHLESKELIHRTIDTSDKRNILLTTTDKGKELIHTLNCIEQQANASVFNSISPLEKDVLRQILTKIEKELE